MSIKSPPSPSDACHLLTIPREIQIHLLTYLRAVDLSALQRTCRYYYYDNVDLIDEIVVYTAKSIYPLAGLALTLTSPSPSSSRSRSSSQPSQSQSQSQSRPHQEEAPRLHTLTDLRNMELAVIAKILSSPEPKSGYYVSKTWIRKTLLWLEKAQTEQQQQQQQQQQHSQKKLTKKQLRQKSRRFCNVEEPGANANSDILCTHHNLCRSSGNRSSAGKRRLMDKQAWKILKKLYPDSTQLDSVQGECLQCLMEAETAKKTQLDLQEQAKIQRKKPLSNIFVRRFYARNSNNLNGGVPTDSLRPTNNENTTSVAFAASKQHVCPLVAGTYYILPRAWCYAWRKYVKTGQGALSPPDVSVLLCDAHRLALLPPHLEAYIVHGETNQLLSCVRRRTSSSLQCRSSSSSAGLSSLPVGMSPDLDHDSMAALMAAGISQSELLSQQVALMNLHHQQQQQQQQYEEPSHEYHYDADQLDRENHVVIEILTQDELLALESTHGWTTMQNFHISFTVSAHGQVTFSTPQCKCCDPTGSTNKNIQKAIPIKKQNHQQQNQQYSKAATRPSHSGHHNSRKKKKRPMAKLEY